MDASKILVVGDSYSSAVVAGEASTRNGWPLLLGVDDSNMQAVAGSTAAQWAGNFEGRLLKAYKTKADVVIVSLLGNDVFAALKDDVITQEEINQGIMHLMHIVMMVQKPITIIILYTDPFFGANKQFSMLCSFLNATIEQTCLRIKRESLFFFDTRNVLKKEDFDGKDIHPNRKGHEAIAQGLAELIKKIDAFRST
jgi:lysophospholipase L1-like esterase